MLQYCLDANVFIQSQRQFYALDIFPVFWNFLDRQFVLEIICSSKLVYDELIEADDDLASWIKTGDRKKFFIEPDESTQSEFVEIANYVNINYPQHQADRFLAGADPWVIAFSKAQVIRVVTQETLVPPTSRKVKIPNICQQFNVRWVNLFEMLRALKARF